MASLAMDQTESIDVIKTEDLFFELLESVAVTNKYTLNTEFKNLSTSLKQDIGNLFIKKEGPSGKTRHNETIELIMVRLLKHMEEINDYSFIIKEIKKKISGKYSFEELRDYNEIQMYRETLQNFIKKYIEALIKSEENLSQSSRQSETQGQGATGAYVATPRPTFNQNKRNIRRNLIDEFNAESDKKNTNKKRKRGGKKRRNNKKTKKRKSKKRKSKRRKSRKHKTKRKR
tara:strand:- start:322 stop:1014 length:693 start_codon:yes stop_codon:yes gene_type:complete